MTRTPSEIEADRDAIPQYWRAHEMLRGDMTEDARYRYRDVTSGAMWVVTRAMLSDLDLAICTANGRRPYVYADWCERTPDAELVMTLPEPYATAHRGPKGRTEYRIWTGPATFRVVSRYKAWELLSDDERAHAEALEATRKAERAATSDNATAWRHIMRGG